MWDLSQRDNSMLTFENDAKLGAAAIIGKLAVGILRN